MPFSLWQGEGVPWGAGGLSLVGLEGTHWNDTMWKRPGSMQHLRSLVIMTNSIINIKTGCSF